MLDVQIQVQGLKQFARELKQIDKGLGKELRQAHLKIAKLVEQRTHGSMRAAGRQAAKATKGVRAKATQKMAAIQTTPGPGWTLAVLWGQKQRSGWYGFRRYQVSTSRQFKPWVGNQYVPGSGAGKPYFLGDAMNRSVDEAVDMFGDAIDDLARRAGFD